MGLPWYETSVNLLTMVASATQSAALFSTTKGMIFVPVYCIIG